MGREYPLRPIVGVGAIILDEENVLIVRRGQPPKMGAWSIPGGGVHLGEDLEEACMREVKEETGLDVEILSEGRVLNRVTRDEWERIQFHYVLIDFVCRPVGGALQAASDISEARWVPLSEVSSLSPMTSGTAEFILESVASLKQSSRWKYREIT
ncbi:MAG: NUDIX hydrolase [Nitrospinae bacterium]|nr:NUDIX hydrolase [Nitrospinota bacterium]